MCSPKQRLAQIHLACLSAEFNHVPGVRAICRMSDRRGPGEACSICFLAPDSFVQNLRESLEVGRLDGSLQLTWSVTTVTTPRNTRAHVLQPSVQAYSLRCPEDQLIGDLEMLRRQFLGDRPTDLGQLAERVLQSF